MPAIIVETPTTVIVAPPIVQRRALSRKSGSGKGRPRASTGSKPGDGDPTMGGASCSAVPGSSASPGSSALPGSLDSPGSSDSPGSDARALPETASRENRSRKERVKWRIALMVGAKSQAVQGSQGQLRRQRPSSYAWVEDSPAAPSYAPECHQGSLRRAHRPLSTAARPQESSRVEAREPAHRPCWPYARW